MTLFGMSKNSTGFISAVLCLLAVAVPRVASHGRLIDPPNRGTMWRFGFNNPEDVQDHELNCGGQTHQWQKMGGKCGFCGDPYDMSPRAHEAGGKFANGIIVDTYREGQTVTFTLDITAPHKGYFEFRLCPVNNPKVRVTQSCLDRNLLRMVNGQTRYFLPKTLKANNVTVAARLPTGLTCSQCVLQWKYRTGKDWGCDKPGNSETCCIGCGPQEEFYGCADVSIVKRGSGGVITKATTSRTTTRRTTTRKTTTRRTTTPRPTTARRTTSRRTTSPRVTTTRRITQRRTTPARSTTSRRTFIWQRITTLKPVTYTIKTTTSSWWKRPVTKERYTKKTTTRKPYYTKKTTTRKPYYTKRTTTRNPPVTKTSQSGKNPTWTWKVSKTTKSWWNNRIRR